MRPKSKLAGKLPHLHFHIGTDPVYAGAQLANGTDEKPEPDRSFEH
jgi:hypothetical protein